MDVNRQLTDRERVELTKKAYKRLFLGQKIKIGGRLIGRVAKKVYAPDGMRAFVIRKPPEYTILFKGSSGFKHGNLTTWRDEWFSTNFPIFFALLAKYPKIPSQLITASVFLNGMLKEHPQAHFYVYGHSLGAINAEYALVNCPNPQAIIKAYLYEGTNIWLLLTRKQRRRAKKIWHKIFNYVDIHDPVTLGLTASHRMIGKLQYVDSEKLKPITQHMWGGYHFDKNGNLKLRQVDRKFLQAVRHEDAFLRYAARWSKKFNRIERKEHRHKHKKK